MPGQLLQHVAVPGPPEVLILLELVVLPIAAFFLVGAVKDGATQINQHESFEFTGCLFL